MSDEIINAPVTTQTPEAVGGFGANALAGSTPEYAPAVQMMVENITPDATPAASALLSSSMSASMSPAMSAVTPGLTPASAPGFTSSSGGKNSDLLLLECLKARAQEDAAFGQTLRDFVLGMASADPDFELHRNVRALRDQLQQVTERMQNLPDIAAPNMQHPTPEHPTPEPLIPNAQHPNQGLIDDTRALARAVKEELDFMRNTTVQLNNQMRIVMEATSACLREMDKTALQYEKQGESGALLDELRSLRDMLAVKFENARLEPIMPEPGEPFRYNEHRADTGFASAGKIKRAVFPGFRWTQPMQPVVLLHAIVETE